jgi:hypothetical protein
VVLLLFILTLTLQNKWQPRCMVPRLPFSSLLTLRTVRDTFYVCCLALIAFKLAENREMATSPPSERHPTRIQWCCLFSLRAEYKNLHQLFDDPLTFSLQRIPVEPHYYGSAASSKLRQYRIMAWLWCLLRLSQEYEKISTPIASCSRPLFSGNKSKNRASHDLLSAWKYVTDKNDAVVLSSAYIQKKAVDTP